MSYDIKSITQSIVADAKKLKDKYTNENDAPVNYACIFCQSEREYSEFLRLVQEIGKIAKDTASGPLFHINDLNTVAGKLKLLKIRKPDPTKTERGDADFTVSNYDNFKNVFLTKQGFKLIKREYMEMIELMDPDFDVRAYFSNPPMDKQLDLEK